MSAEDAPAETTTNEDQAAKAVEGLEPEIVEHVTSDDEPTAEEEPEPGPEPEPIDAPHSWSKEAKELFSKLPREAQDYIATREKERDRGISQKMEEIAQQRKRYERLEGILAPHREQWALKGQDQESVIQRLVAAQNALDRDPVSGIAHIAQSYGLTIPQLAQVIQEQQAGSDPQVLELRRELNNLRSYMDQKEQANQQQTMHSLEQEVLDFSREEKDGQLLRPYIEDVSQEMMPLVAILRENNRTWSNQQVLQEAYDRAVYANPSTRQKLLDAQQAQAKAQRLKEQKEKAAQAKKAGASISGAPGGVNTTTQAADDVRDELMRLFNELG